MNWGTWNRKTIVWGLASGLLVLAIVTGLAAVARVLETPVANLAPFNLGAYFIAGSLVAGMTHGSAKEGAQGGILVGLLDGGFGWIPPTLILADRPDLNSTLLMTPAGFAWDLFLAGLLISFSFAVLLGMLGGWVIARLRTA